MDRKALVRAYLETPRPAGVYRIRNTASGRSLLGVSSDIPSVLRRQQFQLEHGSHPDKELQADWNALGPEMFAFETLDLLKISDDPEVDPAEDLRALKALWVAELTAAGTPLYPRSLRDA
jgi:hypothetical protein